MAATVVSCCCCCGRAPDGEDVIPGSAVVEKRRCWMFRCADLISSGGVNDVTVFSPKIERSATALA